MATLWARSSRNSGSIPSRLKTFLSPPKRSDGSWSTLSLLFSGYHVFFPQTVKCLRRAADHLRPYNVSVTKACSYISTLLEAEGQIYCTASYHLCY